MRAKSQGRQAQNSTSTAQIRHPLIAWRHRLKSFKAEAGGGMTPGPKSTSRVHLQNQAVGVLLRDLQPCRKDQQALTHGIWLPVLFPTKTPVFISQLLPQRLCQSKSKSVRHRAKAVQQLIPLILRPLRRWKPCQQRALIRRLWGMLNSQAMQP
jgi:hypothetical protein